MHGHMNVEYSHFLSQARAHVCANIRLPEVQCLM